jgi:hypothetical protein
VSIPAAPELASLGEATPTGPLTLVLPGESITLTPENADTLFQRDYADTETLLAVHRFAWLPVSGHLVDSGWVDRLWRSWVTHHGNPDDSWAWHPYTAAERAINILDFARKFGFPGESQETRSVLAAHVNSIIGKLEYYGPHNTSNHLSNNGRGLYLIGLALGIERAVEIGARILLQEAERLFTPSGMLREGSSHYHLLLTRNYASAWLAAQRHGRPEANALEAITARALLAAQGLGLPGGLPLIGDISPDCPPDFLNCLLPDGDIASGWGGLLSDDERERLSDLKATSDEIPLEQLASDGWQFFPAGPWSSLWHVPREGWSPMPGHGHQDMGSFELHHGPTPIFIDPGRGAYGDEGDAAYFVSAKAHNGVIIDGADPYPPNKPYYSAEFRKAVAGCPRVKREHDGIVVSYGGFERLRGVGDMERHTVFSDREITITDQVSGTGSHRVTRRLHTSLPVRLDGDSALIDGPDGFIRLTADGPIKIEKTKRWTAYGVSGPAAAIDITVTTILPKRLKMTIAVENAR